MATLSDKILSAVSRRLYKLSKKMALSAEPGIKRSMVVCGWTGSGSTLVSQIGQHLGLKVIKIHGAQLEVINRVKLFMIRDPRDVISSNARRESRHIYDEQGIDAAMRIELDKFLNMGYVQDYYDAIRDPGTIVIKYEEMVKGKEPELITFIATQFGLSVLPRQMQYILEETSIEKNDARSSKIDSFEEYDRKSLIHGHHITNKGESGRWKEDMNREFRIELNKVIGQLIIDSGYEINDNWVQENSETASS